MKLILVRHGQTDANLSGALDTAVPGKELNTTGLKQAQELVEKWSNLGLPKADAIFCSNLTRTKQTISPLAQHWGMDVTIDERCREICAGDLEMASDADSVSSYMFTIGAWMKNFLEMQMPGGETGQQVLDRFDAVVQRAFEAVGEDGVAVITAHGAIIRYWTAMRAQGVTFPLAATCPVPNASTTFITGKPGAFVAQTWADKPIGEWNPPTEAEVLSTSKEAWLDNLHNS